MSVIKSAVPQEKGIEFHSAKAWLTGRAATFRKRRDSKADLKFKIPLIIVFNILNIFIILFIFKIIKHNLDNLV